MKLTIALAAFFLSTSSCLALDGKVVGIADGDTLTVLDANKRQHKIRMASIDAPERYQAYGTRARKELSDLIFSKQVHVSEDGYDRYKRLIGIVSVNGLNVNAEMVKRGFAWTYEDYLNPRDADFVQYQKEADLNNIGLWADANPTPPWEFRKTSKKKYAGKTCKSFSTCAEAKQSLKEGNSKLDGDGDGIPCASLCKKK